VPPSDRLKEGYSYLSHPQARSRYNSRDEIFSAPPPPPYIPRPQSLPFAQTSASAPGLSPLYELNAIGPICSIISECSTFPAQDPSTFEAMLFFDR